jgi:hypothetical protein
VFAYCSIESVTFPAGLEGIGEASFHGSGVVELVLPDSLRVIGCCGFSHCKKLRCVTFGRGLRVISPQAFEGCDSLVSLEFPESLETIGAHAFSGCSRVASAALPALVGTIGAWAFWSTGLTSVTLPPWMEALDCRAFANCRELTAVTIGDIERWSSDRTSPDVSPFGEADESPARRIMPIRLIGERWETLRPALLAPFLSPKAKVVSQRFAGRHFCGILVTTE